MAANIDADEWAGWLAFHAIEPFGPRQDDTRAGVVASAVVRAVAGGSCGPDDFFPSLKPAGEPTRSKAGFRRWACAMAPGWNALRHQFGAAQ